MLLYWLENKLAPTWNEVVQALEQSDQLVLAAQVKLDYLWSTTVDEEQGSILKSSCQDIVCCRCKTGSCKGCSCAKAGKQCADCLPSREGRCMNSRSSSIPQVTTLQTSVTQSSSPCIAADKTVPPPRPTLNIPADLPPFASMSAPSFLWGDLSGQDCTKQLIGCYNEAIHWRRNLFKVPQGKAGNEFVQEISRIFRSYAEASSLESIALTAAILFPILVLQKPHSQSTSKDLASHMARRIKLWTAGSFSSLMTECRSIQHRLPSNKSAKHQFSLEKSFNSLMRGQSP